jgi:N-acetylneuraminic acid mutarotase
MGAACIENKLFVAGGEYQDGVSDQLLQLDLKDLNQGWIQVGTLPFPVSHVQLLADKSKNLYVVGGRKANKDATSTLYQALLKSSDGGKHWVKLPDIPFTAAAGVACILPDDGLWLLSADRGGTFHHVETLIVAAKQASDQQKAQQLLDAKNQLQVNHPGFGRDIWRYDLTSEKWEKRGALPSNAPVTTTAVIWDDMIVIPSGEIKAGVRSPEILSATFSK